MAAKKTTKKKSSKSDSSWNVAKTDDGTIQITFTIPFSEVEKSRVKAMEEMAKNLTVPGFRKGKAPAGEAAKHISREKIVQQTLGKIVPELFAKVIKEDNLKPAVYPKFELLKSEDNEPWEVRGTTCELPNVELGKYKELVKKEAKSSSKIWTPDSKEGKDTKDEKPESVKLKEKEQEVIAILLKNIEITVPKMLIEEEVNNKLSQLLERIEKLGLQLDSYLKSVNKDPVVLRKEYEQQSEEAIKLDLILNKVAEIEKISVSKEELDIAVTASSSNPDFAAAIKADPNQIRLVESILIRRKALQSIIDLI